MKKTLFFCMMSCMVMLSACNPGRIAIITNDKNVEPSANIVKKELRQSAFSKIDIDVMANVKFIQSKDDDYRVVLSMPDNYIDLFRFAVDKGELKVKFNSRNIHIDPMNVDITIYSPTLRELENEGLANVEIDRLKTDELKIDNSGVGSMYLSGLDVKRIEAECSGVGSIELSGHAEKAELECSGVGSIKAVGLEALSVVGDVSGVGGITCHAVESLRADVSGVGSLKYKGSPADKKVRRSGVGKVEELN